jgi:endonuclease YncB( thermonuclease family)
VPLLLAVGPADAPAAAACRWREPPRTFPVGVWWSCAAVGWADGDTLRAECGGAARPVSIRLRGVDTGERGQGRWRQARGELRRRTAGQALAVRPHHRSHRRAVADALAGDVDVALDADGWS